MERKKFKIYLLLTKQGFENETTSPWNRKSPEPLVTADYIKFDGSHHPRYALWTVSYFIFKSSTTHQNMAASFAALLDSLPNEENKITVLEDLKTALGSLPHSHVAEIAANTSFDSVFECLGTDNRYAEKKFCCVMFLACLQKS